MVGEIPWEHQNLSSAINFDKPPSSWKCCVQQQNVFYWLILVELSMSCPTLHMYKLWTIKNTFRFTNLTNISMISWLAIYIFKAKMPTTFCDVKVHELY